MPRGFEIIYFLADALVPMGTVGSLVFPGIAIPVTLFEVGFQHVLENLPLCFGRP